MENNMHLWEIHYSCSFFHIQEEASNVKWKKTTSTYERFTLLASFHIQDRRSNRSEMENHKYKIFTYREEASDMENCIYERFTLLVAFHIPEGRSNRSEMAKPQVQNIQYSHIQEKEAFKSDMDNHKYEERFSSSCSFSHTGGSSFKYDMEKTASIRRDSLFLAVFHIQQKALNLKWKTTSMRGFT